VKSKEVSGLKIYYVYFHDTRFVPIHAYEIVSGMVRRGWEVHVYTSIRDKGERRKISRAGARVHNIWTIRARFISELLFMAALAPYFCIQYFLGRPDIFYTRHSATSLMVALIGRLFGIPCALEINDIIMDKLQFSKISRLKSLWIRLYHYGAFHLADLLLPVTEQIGRWIKEVYRLGPGKVVVVPNGVNPYRFSPKPNEKARLRYRIPLDCRVVLSLGSLFPWVGIETLIAAAPKVLKVYPDTVFAIGSGEEPYLSNIKKAVRQSNMMDAFLFFGFIPWDDASWFISASDICVAPFIFKSTRSGISSLRVFSYLACARPVIGSDIPGLGDMLEEEAIGFSFAMGDHRALARRIVELFGEPERAREMGERGRKFVLDNHSWDVIVGSLGATFQTLMARKKG
jgi:glycosyltransferase involved in cell wall biosynthesis